MTNDFIGPTGMDDNHKQSCFKEDGRCHCVLTPKVTATVKMDKDRKIQHSISTEYTLNKPTNDKAPQNQSPESCRYCGTAGGSHLWSGSGNCPGATPESSKKPKSEYDKMIADARNTTKWHSHDEVFSKTKDFRNPPPSQPSSDTDLREAIEGALLTMPKGTVSAKPVQWPESVDHLLTLFTNYSNSRVIEALERVRATVKAEAVYDSTIVVVDKAIQAEVDK